MIEISYGAKIDMENYPESLEGIEPWDTIDYNEEKTCMLSALGYYPKEYAIVVGTSSHTFYVDPGDYEEVIPIGLFHWFKHYDEDLDTVIEKYNIPIVGEYTWFLVNFEE